MSPAEAGMRAAPSELSLADPVSVRTLRRARPAGPLDRLYLRSDRPQTAKLLREVARWPAVRSIEVWAPVTRAGLREVLKTPGLEALYLMSLRPHGSLHGMALPPALSRVVWGFGLPCRDIRDLCKLPGLGELGAQHAGLSAAAVAALAAKANLSKLDLEGSTLDDALASGLAQSRTILELEIGATRVTSAGLRRICDMTQLRALDIWALDIREQDLEALAGLPDLEYLSVGGVEGQTTLTAAGVLPRLAELPALKRVWLDGIALNQAEIGLLKERYDHVQVT